MFKNYIKIAWRNIWKNRLFSLISIISLSIGVSATMIIGMMIYFESTFDTFHKDGDLIYRITTNYTTKGQVDYNRGVALPLTKPVEDGMTGVETASTFFLAEPNKVENKIAETTFKNPEFVIYADGNYFKLIHYQWLAGNPTSSLENPNEVVLTASRAEKYFPKLNPTQIIGKTLIYNDSVTTKVVGIVADLTQRTDFNCKEFISLKTGLQTEFKQDFTSDNWNSTNSSTQLFIKLNNKNSKASVQKQFQALAKKHQSADAKKYGSTRNFHLQPLSDMHFDANYGTFDFNQSQASKKVLTSLILAAAFLLLLGCINFINLNTAQATQRAKEIGVRKTLGSSKKQLMFQFMGETFFLTLLAALFSLLLVAFLLKVFADFLPEGLTFGLLLNPVVALYVMLLVLVVSIPGLYPSVVLTRFKPISVLKGQAIPGEGKSRVRQSLTVFQFVIAQVFIMATLLVGKQIHYLLHKDMGFKTDAIAYVRTPWADKDLNKRELLLQKIKAIPQVSIASLGGNAPASGNIHSTDIDFADGKKEIHTELQFLYGDTSYLNLYQLKLLAGRNLISDTTKEFVINEAAMRTLGFKNPQDAIGKTIFDGNSNQHNPIVGVVADFNQRSLRSGIEPMALIGDWSRQRFSQFQFIHFALQKDHPENWAETIAKVNAAWKEVYPTEDFEPTFLDNAVKKFYKSETSMAMLLNWATGLSIVISCLGLLGLVIYTTEKRTKEIGIRKVLGASVIQLAKLLCIDFLALVGLAFIIALPIAWWGVNQWISDFTYRTELSWWLFLISGVGMILIALLTMSFKTIKTANENPVKSLRSE
ncbi:putative ABC transport system permease protein [Pedobacter sp. UYP30]|uniref:ABC transporter permease n=1 Tax=Pedobacter sp. UYP30 TaxID=1756400 RepID=UPI00339242B9